MARTLHALLDALAMAGLYVRTHETVLLLVGLIALAYAVGNVRAEVEG